MRLYFPLLQTLKLDIRLQPEQITDLAERISKTINSLTNIDDIIEATRHDLRTATDLQGMRVLSCPPANTRQLDMDVLLISIFFQYISIKIVML